MSQYNTDIHKELIELSKSGSRRAQLKLYELYSKAMYSVALRLLNNREDASDILQEAFTEAFKKINTFRFESTFGAWLKKIVINRSINELNRRNTLIDYLDDLPDNIYNIKDECNCNDDFEAKPEETVKQIRKAMEILPDGSRTIFSLYLLEGYDHTEIAQILNISESTSKSQFMRAKSKIKDFLIHSNYESR